MMLKSVVVLSILVALAAAFPATSEYEPSPDIVSLCDGQDASCDEAEEIEKARAALYSEEGDIIYDEDRNAIPNDKYRWTNGVMPFTIASGVSPKLRNLITNAHALIKRRTGGCITFVERKAQANYVHYQSPLGSGCNSRVGMVGGKQVINLGSGCDLIGTVIHEILHALGFHHEHQRSDRDKYIAVNLKNVQAGMESNFNKQVDRIYNAFDYKGIMIYGEYAFSKDGKSKTMWDKTGKNTLEDAFKKTDMTNSDVTRIKKLYKC